MKAKDIVEALLDPDDPAMNVERYAQAMGMQQAAKERDVLEKFKRSVRAYIKWANPREEGFWGVPQEDLVIDKTHLHGIIVSGNASLVKARLRGCVTIH